MVGRNDRGKGGATEGGRGISSRWERAGDKRGGRGGALAACGERGKVDRGRAEHQQQVG